VLDWHGDHPFTNFHDALNALRGGGFFVEVLHSPGTCFDPRNYGAYLATDSEEEWYRCVGLGGGVRGGRIELQPLVVLVNWEVGCRAEGVQGACGGQRGAGGGRCNTHALPLLPPSSYLQ
jgi:hypothetical protein